MHSRTKHFELDIHSVCDFVQQKRVHLVDLSSQFQVVDLLTRSISGLSLQKIITKLMVVINPTIILRRTFSGLQMSLSITF